MNWQNIKNTLVEQRKRKGLSQDKLASILGVSMMSVSYYETGRRLPSTDKFIAWAKALGLKVCLMPEQLHTPDITEIEAEMVGLEEDFQDEVLDELIDEAELQNEVKNQTL